MSLLLVLGLLSVAADDGNVDQQVRLSIRGDKIEVEVTVQLGRRAAFAEALQIDADRDGTLAPEETAAYFARLEETVRGGLELRVDGRDVPWRRSAELRLEMPFRKIYRFEAARGGGSRLEVHNENFAASPGTASLVVEPAEGLDVLTDADPGSLQRDLACALRPGEGRVVKRPEFVAGSPTVSSAALLAGRTLRALALVALPAAWILARRRRRVAAIVGTAAAALLGAPAVRLSVPAEPEAARLFLALHEDQVRGSDPGVRRVKPLETRIEPALGLWGPEFAVRHRWVSHAALSHSGHAHPEIRECESSFRVSWKDGAWRLTETRAGGTESSRQPLAKLGFQ
jgi:hypothetical protein